MIIHAYRFVFAAAKRTLHDHVFDLAAGLAYYTLLSIFPLMLVVLAVVGQVLSESAQEQLIERLAATLPTSRDLIVDNVRDVARLRGPVGVIAVVFLVWSGSNVFGAAERMLNRVWHVQRPRAFHAVQLRRIGMGLLSTPLLIASFGASVALQAAANVFVNGVAIFLSTFVIVLVSIGVFTLIYRFGPNARVTWGAALAGGATGGIGFEVGKLAFAVYAANFSNFALVYGALAGTIAFLIWIYWSCVFLLIGAEVAAVSSQYAADYEDFIQ